MSLTQTSDPLTTNTRPLQNLFLTATLISSPCPRPGFRPDTTSANLSQITPPGHNLHQQPREGRRGGGLDWFLVKDGLDSSVVPTKSCTTCENFLIKISIHKESFYCLNIYRPPSSSTSTFFEQFQSLLEDIHHTTENLVIIGDFNFHLESTSSNSKTFNSLIDSFDLTQKVNFPTHIYGHTLDLLLTKSNNDHISNVHTTDAFSDHFSFTCTLHLPTPRSQINATVSFRKYHKINKEKMKTDLIASDLINNPSKDADTLNEQYHSTLTTLIDKHAPHTKHTKAKYIPGWVNEAVIAAKETKRLFERIWCRNKSHFNRSQYMQKVHQYNRICMQAKSEFLKAKIQDNHHDPQNLWRVLGDVLHRFPAKMLPLINPPRLLADRFVEFFTEKIEKIRSIFPTSLKSQHIAPDSPPPVFSTFSTVTKDQVTKIIMKSPSKSCSLGPLFLFLTIWIFSSLPLLQ